MATAGLFHQQHYSNFYHMFSEVAPTMHHVVCKWLGDCTYDAHSRSGGGGGRGCAGGLMHAGESHREFACKGLLPSPLGVPDHPIQTLQRPTVCLRQSSAGHSSLSSSTHPHPQKTISSPRSLRLFFVQEKQAGQPAYIMLDSLADVFKCLSPAPVLHKDDAPLSGRVSLLGSISACPHRRVWGQRVWASRTLQDPNPNTKHLQVVILEKAVVGVSPEVRVFHNWEKVGDALHVEGARLVWNVLSSRPPCAVAGRPAAWHWARGRPLCTAIHTFSCATRTTPYPSVTNRRRPTLTSTPLAISATAPRRT